MSIAIEVETGNSNVIENVEKCLDANFSLVVSVRVNGQIEAQIKEELEIKKSDRTGRAFVINFQKFE